jgi:TolB-like protein/DNA-binding winged helix-turn-helix (wHTH) protein
MDTSVRERKLARFGLYEADLQQRVLTKSGIRVRLQDQPFQVLAFLLERPGEIVTREEILQRLWSADTHVEFEDGLNTAINKLRVALGDDANNPRFIETVPRRGYRFIAPVEGALPASAQDSTTQDAPVVKQEALDPAIDKPDAKVPAPSGTRTQRWPVWLAFIAGAALVTLLVGFKAGGLRQRFFGRPDPGAIRSLAVLPLENLSHDPEQEYFADGMTDELITNLASIASLRVISRTSTTHYKGTRKTLPEIARELDVDAVVEGSVERSANQVRIRAQLIRATPEQHLWAESYDRELRDVLQLQGEVAHDIAQEISSNLASAHSQPPTARPVNLEAYDDYLRGRYYWQRLTRDDLIKGIGYLERSIQHDPNYAPAYVDLAFAYSALGSWLGWSPPGEVHPKAKAAAMRALALDQNLAEAHAVLGLIYLEFEWNWAAAENESKLAVELNPNSSFAHSVHAYHLAVTGQTDAAISETSRALKLDPLSQAQHENAAIVFLCARKFDRAIQEARTTVAIDPSYALAHVGLASALGAKGMDQESFMEWLQYLTLSGDGELARELTAAARKISGPSDPGQKLGYITLRYYQKKSKTQYVSPFTIAEAYLDLGDKNHAFEWLRKAYQEHSAALHTIKFFPEWDPLRSDPRFQTLLRDMNFPD